MSLMELFVQVLERAKGEWGQKRAETLVSSLRVNAAADEEWARRVLTGLDEEVEALGGALAELRKAQSPVAFGLAMDRWAQGSALFQHLAPLAQHMGDKTSVIEMLEKAHANLVKLRDGFLRQPTKTQAALEKAAESVGVAGVWS